MQQAERTIYQIEAGRPEDPKEASELKRGKKERQMDYLVYLTALEV